MEREPKLDQTQKIDELHKKWEYALERDKMNIFNKCMAFAKNLIEKYGREEAQNYRLFHLLIGSTPSKEEPCTEFDFPGDDSIEKFINEL